MGFIRNIYFKVRIYFAGQYTVYKLYQKYYGVKIGSNSRFTGKKISFGGEPYLVDIGNNVTITSGVKFQTHDGGVGLFRKEYPGLNVFGTITVGNNVFIGEDTMIMYNVRIGNNVVIGARSLVTKDIPDNTVVAGSPARAIKTLDEYLKSALLKGMQVQETDPEKRKAEIMQKLGLHNKA